MPILDTSEWATTPDANPSAPAGAKPSAKTGLVDGLKATWQQEGIWASSGVKAAVEYPNDTSFDYKSYDKSYWPIVAEARNRDHADALVKQVEKEKKNRQIMEDQSFGMSLVTNLAVGATNPLNYIGLGKAASLGVAALKASGGAVLGTALTEPILHANQATRTVEESMYNIAGAAVVGGVLGVGAKAVGNKIVNGSFTDSGAPLPRTQLNEGITQGFGADSISAARASSRTMDDSKLLSIPFIPKSWTDPLARFSATGRFGRSANQRLSTSTLQSSRNAQNVLLRTNLATNENAAGVANAVPIEVAVGQRAGDLYTKLIETDGELREAWWKKVESGTYDRDDIMAQLKAIDPSIGDDYKLNRTSFDRVLKAYMADSSGFGSQMDEVVKRVDLAAQQREALDADKIDFGLADKSQLEDIATGQRLLKPDDTPDFKLLTQLRTEREAIATELATLRKAKAPKNAIDDAKSRLAAKDAALDAKKADVEKYKADYDTMIVSSKTHRFAYEDGSHYLSRAFDKGRIIGNRRGFEQSLIDGWTARNPNMDRMDPDVYYALKEQAEMVTNKLLNEDDTISLGDLKANLDSLGNYSKDRTLNLDDRFLLNWTSDDVLATEMYHLSQATVDVELAKAGVNFNELITAIRREVVEKTDTINVELGLGTPAAKKQIRLLEVEAKRDIEELEFAMRRLKRKGPARLMTGEQSLNEITSRFNAVAGMAQLGSSAFPNSLGDLASVARNFGTGRMLKMVGKAFTKEARDDIAANAKQMGMMSDLLDNVVREQQFNDVLNDSMNPNKGLKAPWLQKVDGTINWTQDKFQTWSFIQPWAKIGRVLASSASTQHIIDAASKGWDNLSSTSRADFAKFYIDKDMLDRIGAQIKAHSTAKDDMKFASIDDWTDEEAKRIFRASVYAHTEHALNIPSIGTGSQFMSETFLGRMLNRFQSFNNAAYESMFLSSLQNRDITRIGVGVANYAFINFASLFAYDFVTGRDTSMEKYFGDGDKATVTAWKILLRGGFVAASADTFLSAVRLAGGEDSPIAQQVQEWFPKSLEDELFPKYDDVGTLEKLAGPTYGYISNIYKATTGALDGELSDKDVGAIRGLISGQNIGWLRRGIDYVEEALGGRDVDRNADK